MRRALVLLLPFVLAVSAAAGETSARRVALPREGLTVDVPAGWAVRQYGEPVLELVREGAAVRFFRAEEAAGTYAARTWTEAEDGSAACTERFARDGRFRFRVEAEASAHRDEVDGILDSVDLRPYQHPELHVDWRDGWTLAVPKDWRRVPEKDGFAHFVAPDGVCRLQAERLPDLLARQGGGDGATWDHDAWVAFARKEAVHRAEALTGLAAMDDPAFEKGSDPTRKPMTRIHIGLDPDDDLVPRAWVHVLVCEDLRVLILCQDDGERDAKANRLLQTFVYDPRPGRLVAPAPAATDTFPGENGPPVVFRLPAGWTQAEGTNRMRLAQVVPGDVEDLEAVVYWFGAGGGGGLEENLDRWRGQMGDAEGTTETIDVAEDVKATLLDVEGSYAAQSMGPHANPHAPHGAAHEGFRMLAVVFEVPEGPLYVKMVGEKEAVDQVADAFRDWVRSFRVKK